MVVGRLLSYWEGNFSGAMLNFGRVPETGVKKHQPLKHQQQTSTQHIFLQTKSCLFSLTFVDPKIWRIARWLTDGLRMVMMIST